MRVKALSVSNRKRTLDSSIIRVGDNIKIIVPEVVDRVGYPLTKKIIVESMTREQKNALYKSVAEIFGLEHYSGDPSLVFLDPKDDDRLLYAVADKILAKRGWGGRERKIYIKIVDSYKDQVYTVIKKKVVKTGIYNYSSSTYDYWSGDYDYEPAYLSNEKTHVLYGVHGYTTQIEKLIFWNDNDDLKYFEKRCVQKVIYNSNTGDYE
jgi:hypothetical protein